MASSRQELRRVLLAQSGDREALDGLLLWVQDPLFRYLRGLLRDRARAQDVLQEALFRICLKLRWLRDPELFRPWAYRIATREAFRSLRRERRWSDSLLDAQELEAIPDPAPEQLPSELERLPELVADVSPACRAALLLHYLDGLTFPEIAEVLGVAVGTVKSRIAYGLAALRRSLRQDGLASDPTPKQEDRL